MITKREPWLVCVLAVVTCGFYLIYWQYATTDELKKATGREDLNPVMDLILGILCCGIWMIWAQYRNAGVVHEWFVQRGYQHEDKSSTVIVMHVLGFFFGMVGMLGPLILQEDLNRLATALEQGGAPMPPQGFGPGPGQPPAPRTF
jgi:hypothetical protein